MTLRDDIHKRPELFYWNGPLDPTKLAHWLEEHNLKVPQGLLTLWEETGGGELFETESILSPFGDSRVGDAIEEANKVHHDQGMANRYLLFHHGVRGVSAVDLNTQDFVLLSLPDYAELARFEGFEEWYISLVREPYAGHYRLS